MKTFIISCATAVIIAVIGVVVLSGVQENVDQAYTSPTGVRLGA